MWRHGQRTGLDLLSRLEVLERLLGRRFRLEERCRDQSRDDGTENVLWMLCLSLRLCLRRSPKGLIALSTPLVRPKPSGGGGMVT